MTTHAFIRVQFPGTARSNRCGSRSLRRLTAGRPSKSLPRRLLCESLERRYAMHAMAWQTPDVEEFEYRQTDLIIQYRQVGEVAQVRQLHWHNALFVRPDFKAGSRGEAEGSRISAAESDEFFGSEEPCAHGRDVRRGLGPAEGEFSGLGPNLSNQLGSAKGLADGIRSDESRFGDRLEIGKPGDLARPEPKLNETSRPPTSLSEPKLNESGSNEPKLNELRPIPQARAEVASAGKNLSSVNELPSVGSTSIVNEALGSGGLGKLSAFSVTGTARINGIGNTIASNLFGASHAPDPGAQELGPAKSGSASLPLRTDLVHASNAVDEPTTFAARQAAAQSLTIAGGSTTQPEESASASSVNPMSVQTTHSSSKLSPLASISLSNSTVRSRESSPEQVGAQDANGLLKQLSAVLEDLGSEPFDSDLSLEHSGSAERRGLSRSQLDDAISSSKAQAPHDDGLLELAAPTEALPVEVGGAQADQATKAEVRQRGQLIATLDLHREFDLAGQASDRIDQLVNPTSRIDLAKELGDSWAMAEAEIGVDAPSSSVAEVSLWQRSLLSLGFLAIGGLVFIGRRRYVGHTASPADKPVEV